ALRVTHRLLHDYRLVGKHDVRYTTSMNWHIPDDERAYLRDLARKQAEYAALPVMAQRKQMWYDLNDAHSSTAQHAAPRPPVIVETWTFDRDFMPDRIFRCQSQAGRTVEMQLLRNVRNHELIDDDKVLPDTYDMGWFVNIDEMGVKVESEAVKDAQDLAKTALKSLKLAGHENEPAYGALSRIARHGADNWRQLSDLGKLSSKDEAADACLEPVRAFAERLLRHPGLGADIAAFAESLAGQALELEQHYRRYKTERGLLDYTDLEELFYKLVTNPALREELAEEIQLVVIDEFQDTNPIQLAIFMALSSLAKESIWVGDHKQSIYGFNGTDPELMHAVWELPHVKQGTLKVNRRSGKGLVDFFNEVFTPVFGAKSKLEAHRKAEPAAVERWLLEANNYGEEATALANGVAGLVKKGVRKSEIAVLVRTNQYGEALGAELQQLGIPVSLNLSGLLLTRECAALVAALRIVADRRDSLACATLLHLLEGEPHGTPDWLKLRLEERHNGGETRRLPGIHSSKAWPAWTTGISRRARR
ncbi:MAG: UvrD-helicase domain-containing protein, partial [candidate division NC10 bacterium]